MIIEFYILLGILANIYVFADFFTKAYEAAEERNDYLGLILYVFVVIVFSILAIITIPVAILKSTFAYRKYTRTKKLQEDMLLNHNQTRGDD